MLKKTLKLLGHQYEALNSPVKNTLLLGGVGSGKTFLGTVFCYKNIAEQPQTMGFIGANTYQQLRDVCIPSLLDLFEDLNIEYKYNKNQSNITVNSTTILCRSLERYDNFRGIEIGWYWLDEAAYAKREAFDVVMGRLRCPKAKKHHGLITTTPKGYNWLYDYFNPNGLLNSGEFKTYRASSRDNKHLPEGYIDSLKGQYDDKMFLQEIEGQFVNLTSGSVYYNFDRDKNVEEFDIHPYGGLFIGMDFNVDPMTCVMLQFRNAKLYVFDEIFDRDSSTEKICSKLHAQGYSAGRVIPDSTGRNRKTSGKTDFDIIKKAGFVIESTHNPHVFDRVNNVNRLLKQGKIVIHPRCKKLIGDLEKVSWKNNDLDKTSDKMLTHISDALGYACWKLMPIKTSHTRKFHSEKR